MPPCAVAPPRGAAWPEQLRPALRCRDALAGWALQDLRRHSGWCLGREEGGEVGCRAECTDPPRLKGEKPNPINENILFEKHVLDVISIYFETSRKPMWDTWDSRLHPRLHPWRGCRRHVAEACGERRGGKVPAPRRGTLKGLGLEICGVGGFGPESEPFRTLIRIFMTPRGTVAECRG